MTLGQNGVLRYGHFGVLTKIKAGILNNFIKYTNMVAKLFISKQFQNQQSLNWVAGGF